MMRGFRRAQLRGSDELFRSTDEEPGAEQRGAGQTQVEPVRAVPSAPPPDLRTVRLTVDDIGLLADALQKLKFPKPSAGGRPPVYEYERFEELRQKLLESL